MKNMYVSLIVLITSTICVNIKASDLVFPEKIGQKTIINEDYKDMQWNRYTTKNFVIMSINNKDGGWLNRNLEKIKDEEMAKLGLKYENLNNECRIMVVDNKDLFKKFFNLENSRIEFRKKEGKTEIIGVWVCIEDNNYNEIKKIISQVCLEDLLSKLNSNKKFIEQGISILSLPENEVIKYIKNSNGDISNLFIDETKYKNLSIEEKEEFLSNSVCLNLMLKKELGEKKFLKLMLGRDNNIERILDIYKYNNKEEFEKTFKRYCKDLQTAIEEKKLNNSYLKIEKGK